MEARWSSYKWRIGGRFEPERFYFSPLRSNKKALAFPARNEEQALTLFSWWFGVHVLQNVQNFKVPNHNDCFATFPPTPTLLLALRLSSECKSRLGQRVITCE